MTGLLLCTPKGNNPRSFFGLQAGTMDKYDFVRFLKQVKKEMKGRKLLLIWDGLPAHRAKVVTDYIDTQKDWLRVERYPGYAPELSPVEFIWSPIKGKDLAQVPPKGLKHLIGLVRAAFRRIKRSKTIMKNCLRKAGVLN